MYKISFYTYGFCCSDSSELKLNTDNVKDFRMGE